MGMVAHPPKARDVLQKKRASIGSDLHGIQGKLVRAFGDHLKGRFFLPALKRYARLISCIFVDLLHGLARPNA
jgi:hypothetical protein